MSDSMEVRTSMKVVLRFVCMVSGEWYVKMAGVTLMPKWFAENWDSQKLVRRGGGSERVLKQGGKEEGIGMTCY